MKINTVCGNGLGSSLILKINVDKILKELGVQASVEATDVSSANNSDSNLLVSTTQFENNLKSSSKDKIFVNNITDKADLKDQLQAYFADK